MGFQKGNKIRLGMKNSNKQKEAVRTYMKNRVISKKTLKKMSLARKGVSHPTPWLVGKPKSEEWKQKMKGRKPWNYKGVTSQDRLERIKFRKEVQKLVFERDNYTCQLCGQVGEKLQVDHIQSWKDYVELRFSINNCRTLCQNCHYKITFGKPMPKHIKSWGHNLGRRIATFLQ